MATIEEIEEAVATARNEGAEQIALLRCTSAYPALPSEMNLRTIPELMRRFEVPVGLSDHTMDIAVPVAAVALGACIIEKHFTLSRSLKGPDSAFSLEPAEFKSMVEAVRVAEKSLGEIHFGLTRQRKEQPRFSPVALCCPGREAGRTFQRGKCPLDSARSRTAHSASPADRRQACFS